MVIQPEEEETFSEEQAVEDILMTNIGRETPTSDGEEVDDIESMDDEQRYSKEKGQGQEVQTGTDSGIQMQHDDVRVHGQVAGEVEDMMLEDTVSEHNVDDNESMDDERRDSKEKGKGREVQTGTDTGIQMQQDEGGETSFRNLVPEDTASEHNVKEENVQENPSETDGDTDEDETGDETGDDKMANRVTISKPTKFTRPKGGKGPPLKMKFRKSKPSSSRADPDADELSVEDMFRMILEGMVSLEGQADDRQHSNDTPKPRGRFKKSRGRPRDSQRTVCLKRVRRVMNECLGIKRDSDISEVTMPPDETIRAFELGVGPKPTMKPMQIDWSQGIESRWNQTVFKDFLQHLQREVQETTPPRNSNLNGNTKAIEEMFFSRLQRLRRFRKATRVCEGESEEAFRKRLRVKKLQILKRQREKTRRLKVTARRL
jgi:hypothetical protein